MKSSSEVENISKESTLLVTRAAEQFVKLLTKEAYKDVPKGGKKLDYKNIANVVNGNDRYEFLREIIPHKITVEQYYQIMKEKCNDNTEVDFMSECVSEEDQGDDEKEENCNIDTKENEVSKKSDSDVMMLE
ncbi:hypothetical protein FQR65_LT04320 [Abscondita terminalis]|nr:hypothetical protein FQR65_LT04320 [Abscondita terminalis]